MSVSVYYADVEPLKNEERFRLALEKVSGERREKTLRFRHDKDKRLSLGAELLLHQALGKSGLSDPDISYEYGENGKPYLMGKSGLCFNLSHAGEYVMCAVSDCEVGCDIEDTTDHAMKIARRYYAKDEYARIEALSDENEKNDLFLRYWTLKESFIKCVGQGLLLPLNEFVLDTGPDGTVRITQHVDDRQYHFTEFIPAEGYRAAVCCARDTKPDCRIVKTALFDI